MAKERDLVTQIKQNEVDITRVFNTSAREGDSQTTTYIIPSDVVINEGDEAFDGMVCGGVPFNCSTASKKIVTADYPIGVNEGLGNCDLKSVSAEAEARTLESSVQGVAWAEVKYGFTKSVDSIDATTEVLATTPINVLDEMAELVRFVNEKGFPMKYINIAISESLTVDITKMKLQCCDLGVQNSDIVNTLAKSLGINDAFTLPQYVINGSHAGTTPETKVKYRVYVKDLHPFNAWCELPIESETISTENYSRMSRIFGNEFVGSEMLNNMSEAHMFFADPAPII